MPARDGRGRASKRHSRRNFGEYALRDDSRYRSQTEFWRRRFCCRRRGLAPSPLIPATAGIQGPEIPSSARARRAQHLARGHPPLAAVGPRLLRAGPGDRPRFGGANGEPIAFRRGCGIRVPAGSNAHHRRRPFVGIGGKRRRHGGADGERDEAPCEPGYGHLTHPAAPRRAPGALGVLAR